MTTEESELRIQLFPYERHSLEALQRDFGIEREIIIGFAHSLNGLRKTFEETIAPSTTEFREGRVVIMGLIYHAHRLLAGGLQALESGNGVVWSACARGLMETVGACVRISERPESVTEHMEGVWAGHLDRAAARDLPGLRSDIERLHQIVHPGPRAIYAGFKVLDDKEHVAVYRLGLQRPEPSAGREGVIVLANLAHHLDEKLGVLAKQQNVLSAGKVLMVRTG